jgi:FkbM family methyltransferase
MRAPTVNQVRPQAVALLRRLLPAAAFSHLRQIVTRQPTWRPTASYSQTGEDMILRAFLREPAGGYLDIGAGKPRQGNNTYFLYARGWRGVSVDPLPGNVRAHRRDRPGDTVIRAACADQSGELTFYAFSEYEYSTLDPIRAREVATLPDVELISTEAVPVITIASLGLAASPVDPWLLSLDVEGLELAVLQGNDWETFQPRVLCVEELASPLRERTLVAEFLFERDYELVAYTGLSSIYVHRSIGPDGCRRS